MALNFLVVHVEEEDLRLCTSDHLELHVVKEWNVVIDKLLHFGIGVQSSSTAALDTSLDYNFVCRLLLVRRHEGRAKKHGKKAVEQHGQLRDSRYLRIYTGEPM